MTARSAAAGAPRLVLAYTVFIFLALKQKKELRIFLTSGDILLRNFGRCEKTPP
jgi:hypothetical protein